MATYAELLKQKEQLDAQIEEARKAEIASIIAEVKTTISKYKLKAEDLGFTTAKTKSKGSKEKTITHQNPENPEQTYGGKGPLPQWLKDKIAEGRSKEEFKV